MPRLTLIAGPDGAGKSTLARPGLAGALFRCELQGLIRRGTLFLFGLCLCSRRQLDKLRPSNWRGLVSDRERLLEGGRLIAVQVMNRARNHVVSRGAPLSVSVMLSISSCTL